MSRTFIILACINCFIAVALGAFGAHGLKSLLSADAMRAFKTAVDYHFIHALGLMAIGILYSEFPKVLSAGWLMLAGIVLFSGSLYLLSLTAIKAFGMITPVGGICFMAAWCWLAIIIYQSK
jgi:uncharacterized membrane protein YgdD (TMEM256/DUF423 family)